MNFSRNGKIARLPRAIREQLNQRIRDGEQGKELVVWLNTLPEVREVIDRGFDGKPIREQNFSEWRQGGYLEWLAAEESREAVSRVVEEVQDLKKGLGGTFTGDLAIWLSARYAAASRQLAEADNPKNLRLLREICQDVLELRRCDQSAQRIEIERDNLRIRHQQKTNLAIEELGKEIYENKKALAIFNELRKHINQPDDGIEPDEPSPPPSN